jgi:hypothetical protein
MTTTNTEKTQKTVPDSKMPITFADVLQAVDNATDLSRGVRGNLRAAANILFLMLIAAGRATVRS